MQDPDHQPPTTRREALAPRLFGLLFLMLGLILIAAQARAISPRRSVDGASPAIETRRAQPF